jgi:pimeloyl-ACP methyl ester carboxylesterase
MYATVNGLRLAYSARGRGRRPALLLIHGFPLDRRMWLAQLAGLSRLAHVVAPDLRGHGQSETPPGNYSMDHHADDLAGLLDRLGIQRAIVAGLSMGGYIAFAFWRRHADRVLALALLDTRAEPDTPQARAGRDAAAARVQQVGAEAFAREMLPRLLAPASLTDPDITDRALAIMAGQTPAGIVAALAGLRDRPDSRPTLPTITAPALVVVGAEDALTPPADAAAMAAAIPQARMATIPAAGHLSPLENPAAVNAALRELIRRIGQ